MRFVRGTGGLTVTDNKIIETWKKIQDILKKTENVVLQKEPIDDLVRHITNILDLINRQQAEIDRLEKDSKRLKKVQMQLDDAMKMYNVIKAEAYKEFAERLKENSIATFSWNGVVLVEEIDNLVKEMVGDNDE